MGEDQSQTGRRRLTVAEASEVLDVTVEAVRGRIKRGTLEHERDSGTVYVLLAADQSHDQSRPDDDQMNDRTRPDDHTDITEELRDRISYLERQVEEEREARRRADTILAQLSAANAEQARTIRALEAPQEASDAAETVEEPEAADPQPATGEVREELSAERARREMAESTLHEGMAEQRRRREEAERERDELHRELIGLRERTEAHEAAGEQQGRGQPQSATGGAQRGARRPWWRRMFRS